MTTAMDDTNDQAARATRSRGARTFAAMFAAVPVSLCLFALADTPRPVAQYGRVQEIAGRESGRVARGQTAVPDPTTTTVATTTTTTAAPTTTTPAVDPSFLQVASEAVAPPPPPPPAPPEPPPMSLSVEGALRIAGSPATPRVYNVGGKHAPTLWWAVDGAASVRVLGPDVDSSGSRGRVVPCPGTMKKDKCRPERGTHTYVLTATDEWGREATTSVELRVGPDPRGKRHRG